MPKESGSGMNRRDFLKASAVAAMGVGASVVVLEKGTEAQEQNTRTNLPELTIRYLDTPKPITPEIEDVIKALSHYQSSFTGGASLNRELHFAQGQVITGKVASAEDIIEAKKNIWMQFQNLIPELKTQEFSDDAFFESLSLTVPRLMAEYGILAKVFFLNYSKQAEGESLAVNRKEAVVYFLEVSRIEHNKVEQWGVEIDQSIVHLKGSVKIDGKAVTDETSITNAETAFGNIFIFDAGIETEFNMRLSESQPLEVQINDFSTKGGLANMLLKNLEDSNSYHDAVQMPMLKSFERMERKPTIEEYKGEVIVHETRHIVDGLQGIIPKIINLWKAKSLIDSNNRVSNQFIHLEMNATISQLKYAPNRKFAFYRLFLNARDGAENQDNLGKSRVWIVGHIVGLVSENPEEYGIKISANSKLSQFNQILSQLDVLLDHLDLFDVLIDRLIDYHNQNLTEDIVGETFTQLQGPFTESQPNNSIPLSTIVKIGVPAAVAAGALEALRRRKKKVAAENAAKAGMTRSERREADRKEKKKGKK